MTKLPRLSGHELIKILANFGFRKIRQKGSHMMLIKETIHGKSGCIVPLHDEIRTLIGILRQAKISREEFIKEYKKIEFFNIYLYLNYIEKFHFT